ncbi:response regulator transcription factor [uncultured Enterococcus sp.]|uniref:response regulator transcription factor n=1 Tax=uncultured Enterococcus sp. TaxID=167972 RepID=UPI002AA7D133|nr:response regulator transcription factor [uncultured Enterococcus sp.]
MIRLVVVDDDFLVTTSLKTIIEASREIEVVGTGHSAEDAVKLYHELQPDILLMDIRMGDRTGLDAAGKILSENQDAAILLLTTFSDDEYIVEALKLGVKGYLLKQNMEAIVPSIKAAKNGQSVFGHAVVDKLPNLLQAEKSHKGCHINLTDRELTTLSLIAEGLNNKEIAKELFLSEGTVRNYISVLLEKLELRDRTQLAIFYYKHLN